MAKGIGMPTVKGGGKKINKTPRSQYEQTALKRTPRNPYTQLKEGNPKARGDRGMGKPKSNRQ